MTGTFHGPWRRRTARYRAALLVPAFILVCFPTMAAAQQPGPTVVLDTPLPPSLLLPNYDRVLIGEKEALEAAAFVARAEGAVAAYYNPAGLGLAEATSLTAGISTQEWIRFSATGGFVSDARTTNRSLGGVFGVVLGPDVIGLEKWRFGFLIARPVSIQPALELRSTVPADGGFLSATYVTTSTLSDFAPTVAAAYNYSPTLRFGGAVRLSTFSVYQNQSIFSDLLQGGTLRTVEGTLFSNGSVWSLVFTGGLQWEPRPHLRIGGQVALPSLRLFGGSSNIYRGADLAQGRGLLLEFSDSDVGFRYRQPFAISAGVAWTFERGAVEFDVRQHAGTGRYDIFKSSRPIVRTLVSDDGVVIDETPFPTIRYAGRAVTNISVGGHLRLGEAVTAHAGVYTDRSPADPELQFLFTRLNLVGATGGAAIDFKGFVGSVGLAYISGERKIEVDLPTGTAGPTVRMRALQILYAVSFAF
jgi:hypothetical protein